MDILDEIYINQLAQRVYSIVDGIKWFSSFDDGKQVEILKKISFYALQGGGTGMDVEQAVSNSRLKSTYTPCQLLLMAKERVPLSSSSLRVSLNKIVALPCDERAKSFILFISLLNVIFHNKKVTELDRKDKWWESDLSNIEYVETIIESNK